MVPGIECTGLHCMPPWAYTMQQAVACTRYCRRYSRHAGMLASMLASMDARPNFGFAFASLPNPSPLPPVHYVDGTALPFTTLH